MDSRLASEISSAIIAAEPGFRAIFARDEITLSGDDLEQLMIGIFALGASEGVGVVAGVVDGRPTAIGEAVSALLEGE